MAEADSPKTFALSLLQQALNCGLRGKNRQAVQDCITILEDDGKSDLKDLSYRNLKPGKILRDPNRPGFMMRATKRSKIWIYRYSWENRQPEMRLGLYPEMNLQEAREAWQAARNYRLQGINPETAGQDDEADLTVREMCDKYMQLARQRKRSWKEDQRQIEFDILPSWGDRPVTSITPDDAENLLLTAYDRGSPRSAEKLLTLGRCPGPPNLYTRRSNHSLMKLLPLLYSWMENSQEFVFRHSRCLPNLNRHEFLFPRAGRGA